MPGLAGHRQVTDAHLLTLARRRGMRLVTFDVAIVALSGERSDVELLAACTAYCAALIVWSNTSSPSSIV